MANVEHLSCYLLVSHKYYKQPSGLVTPACCSRMAEAIVGLLVGKLQEMAVSEAKALVAVNGDIRGLRDRLMWMQAFLRHADPRRCDTSDELIRVWLKQTRDVAFDAEDSIDDYSLKIDLSRYEYIYTIA